MKMRKELSLRELSIILGMLRYLTGKTGNVIPIGKFWKTRSSDRGNLLFPLFSVLPVDACTFSRAFV